MDRRWLYGGLLVAGGVVLVAAATANSRKKIAPGDRVLLLGDSMAVGLSAPMRYLAQEMGFDLVVMAREGMFIREVLGLKELQQLAADEQIDHVIVVLGTNDAYAAGTDSLALARLEEADAVIAELESLGVGIFWVGAPALGEYLGRLPNDDYLDLLRERIESAGIDYLASDELPIPRGQDGLHPTLRGYAGWASEIIEWAS